MLTWWPTMAIFFSALSCVSFFLFLYSLLRNPHLAFKRLIHNILLVSAVIFPLMIGYPLLWVQVNQPADKSGMMVHLIAITLMCPLMIVTWIALFVARRKKWQIKKLTP